MQLVADDSEVAVSLAGINVEEKNLVMKSPHISGFQKTKQSYEVTAVRAIQDLDNPKKVKLETIDATFGMAGTQTGTVDAATGVYDGNELMVLTGGINGKTNDGYIAKLDSATINIASGDLTSDTAGRNPFRRRRDQRQGDEGDRARQAGALLQRRGGSLRAARRARRCGAGRGRGRGSRQVFRRARWPSRKRMR